MDVNMTAEDFMVATTKGAFRQLQAIERGRMGSDHGGRSIRGVARRLGDSIIGELGEMAVAKAMRTVQTSDFEDLGAVDIGGKYEVRTTDREDGHLLLHRSSPNDAIYVLAVVKGLVVSLRGWVLARDGKDEINWRCGDPGCYYVPQYDLKPMEKIGEAATA